MEDQYLLGHSADESLRLTVQACLLAPITKRFFLDAGIVAGMRVLDMGSGMGRRTRARSTYGLTLTFATD